jgi:hypothetical protein
VGALTLERWDLPKLDEILVGNGRRRLRRGQRAQ